MRKRLAWLWQSHYEKSLVFLDQAVVSGSNFLIGILISKTLGLHDLGVYSFAWMLLMMCSSLQQNFVSVPMVNEWLRREGKEKDDYLKQLFFLQCVLSFGMSLLCGIGILMLQRFAFFQALHELVWALCFLIFFYTAFDFIRRIYFLRSNLKRLVLLDLLINGTQVGFLVINLSTHSFSLLDTVSFFAFSYVGGFLVGAIELFRFETFSKASIRLMSLHWSLTHWLLAAAVLQWFAGNFFVISAGSLLGTEAAGIVRIAQSIVGVLNVFFIALEMYVPIKAAHIYQLKGRFSLFVYTKKVMVVGLLVCAAFVFAIGFFSSSLLTWLYGAYYAQFSPVITMFAVFYGLVFTGYPLRFALRALDKTKTLFVAYVLATAFSLLFSHYMVHTWGIWGVVAGLAATQLIMQAWYLKELVCTPSLHTV